MIEHEEYMSNFSYHGTTVVGRRPHAWLVRSTPDQLIRAQLLVGNIVLFS